MNKCKYCGKELEKGSYCRPCYSIKRKRKLYGLPESQYELLLNRQSKLCAICGSRSQILVVDHNHSNGQVRGLLCGECNLGLGKFKDDPNLLDKARDYLLKYQL